MEPDRQRRYPVDAGVPATLHRGASRRANHRTDRGRQPVRRGPVHSLRDARRYGRGRADPPCGVEGTLRRLPAFGIGRVAIGHLITNKAQVNGIFQPVILTKARIQRFSNEMDSRFRGNDGLFRRSCVTKPAVRRESGMSKLAAEDARLGGETQAFPGRPRPGRAPFPRPPPLRFDRTRFTPANQFRSGKRPWSELHRSELHLQLDPPAGSPLSPVGSGRSRSCSTDGDFARFDALDRTDLLKQTRARPEMPGGRESSRKSPGECPEPVAAGSRARPFPLVPEVAAAPSVHRPARRP